MTKAEYTGSMAPDHSKPLTIVIPTETYAPEINGAARFAERLAEGLAAKGHTVHVVCPSSIGNPTHQKVGNVWVHGIRSRRWLPHPTWMICHPWEARGPVHRLIRDISPDVVHVQAHFVVGRFGINAAIDQGIPLVATNHFMPENIVPYVSAPRRVLDTAARLAWGDLRRKMEAADVLTVPTQLAADLLSGHGFGAPVRAISCGIDLVEFHEAGPEEQDVAGIDRSHPTVLFVGRLAMEKNVDMIIRAVAASDPALGLQAEIVGAGEQLTSLKALAESLGIADRVHFLGKISDPDLHKAYSRATFFCNPGTAELQSIVTLEAMASAKPVVLADAVALPHLVRDGENGRLFQPGDIQALTAAFNEFAAASPEKLRATGEASVTMARHHDIRHTIDSFEEIYRGLADSRPSSSAAGA